MIVDLKDQGIYRHYSAPSLHPRAAVFLDRDGVIVEEVGYLHTIEQTRLLPGVEVGIRQLNQYQIPTVIVTNQAGIGRGYYTWSEFETVERFIEETLAQSKAHFDAVWACAYHPQGEGDLGTEHLFRKPNTGMLTEAAQLMNLDLARSWMVGDKTIDIQLAINAGLQGAVLVRTGYGREMETEVRGLAAGYCEVHVRDTLADAVSLILRKAQI